MPDINSFVFGPNSGFDTRSTGNATRNYTASSAGRGGVGGGSAASSFNVGSVGDISKLTETLNSMNQQAQQAALANRIPNNPALEAQSSKNIGAELQGQLPQDEVNYLGQAAAERGVGQGLGATSQNTNAAYLRSLGLHSLDLMHQGQGDLSVANARNPIAPIVDSSRYTLTPAESAQIHLGYLTEADRTNLEQQRLAIEAAQGHGGSPGGVGGPAHTTPGSPYQFAEPGTGPIYNSQVGHGVTGGDILGNPDFSSADWQASLGNYRYSTPADIANYGEGGSGYAPSSQDYSNQFENFDPYGQEYNPDASYG